MYWGTYSSSTNRYTIFPLKLSQQLQPSRQRLMTLNIFCSITWFCSRSFGANNAMNLKNHSPEWSSWPYKSTWSIPALKRFVLVKMERNRKTESWSTVSVFFSVQSGPCSDAVYAAGRFMPLCRSPGYCTPACQLLIQPFYTLTLNQDVENTFTHMASERFTTDRWSISNFIHTPNSTSVLLIRLISRNPGQCDGYRGLLASVVLLHFYCRFKYCCCIYYYYCDWYCNFYDHNYYYYTKV